MIASIPPTRQGDEHEQTSDSRRGHRGRSGADRRGERPGEAGGRPGRKPLPPRQRWDLAVEAAPARTGPDRGPSQRPDRGRRRQPPPGGRKRDRRLRADHKGEPPGSRGARRARLSPAAVKEASPDAVGGSGQGEVEVAFPEQAPIDAKGPILLFNGGVHGDTTLLFIHTYVNVPAPPAVVATARITHIHRGHFGLHTVSSIPKIAGGAGSVTGFKLTIDRTFAYKGEKRRYPTAKCPTGAYL